MMLKTKCILFFLSILILAICLQYLLVVNWDAIWLVHCAKLLLQGKHYYTDFFETNPPLIIWLSIPVVWLSSFMSVPVALKSYVFVVSLIMLLIANVLLRKLFLTNRFKHYLLVLILTFAYLILPMYSFGEREQFALMFVLPYLLLVSWRMGSKEINLNKAFIILVGLFAGIGFSLKPYFLPAVVFVELYYMFSKRSFLAVFRIETVTILIFMIAYLFAVYFFTPFYFKEIVSLVHAFYLNGYIAWPVIKLIAFWGFAFALEGMIVLLGLSFFSKEKHLYRVFVFAALGFYIAFLCQGQAWYYHYFPTFALVFILFLYGVFIDFRFLFKSGWPIAACFGAILRIILCLVFLIWGLLFFLNCTVPGIIMKQNPNSSMNQLIAYTKKEIGNKSVLVMSANLSMQQVIRTHTQAKVISRFPMVVFVPGIERYRLDNNMKKYHQLYHQIMSVYMADIKKQKPDFIIYDKTKYWLIKNRMIYQVPVLPFFLRDKQFAAFFKQYKEVYNAKAFLVYTLVLK